MSNSHHRKEVRIAEKVDRFTAVFIASCFLAGIAMAPIYDTWLVAIGVGGTLLVAYYSVKRLLPRSSLYRYVLSAILGLFMAQYIHQMHGMFEMHFFVFIGSTYLVIYKDWKLQVPLGLVVLLHHGLLAYLQYLDTSGVYFSQGDHMSLATFVIHMFLSACIFLLSGFWAYTLRRSRQALARQSFEIGRLREANQQKAALLSVQTDLRELHYKNKEVTDSIRYTQRLQRALLPETEELKRYFAGSFIYERPHSILGGDFLWLRQLGSEMLVACVDCTGHGVPGAFMTIVATDLLNRIVREYPDQPPGIMLEMLDAELTVSMGLEKNHGVADGMDIALCRIDLGAKKLLFAGAINSIVLASAQGTRTIKGNRHCVGGHITTGRKVFETQEVDFEEGEMLYMFSDGITDQFGGANDKKFTRNGLMALVEKIQELTIEQQSEKVCSTFEDWKGAQQQTDDMILVGLELRSNVRLERTGSEIEKKAREAA